MPRLLHTLPAYRFHKATGQAVVTVFGKDHYLGPWRSRASRAEYDRLIGEWLAAGRPSSAPTTDDLRIVELNRRYWEFAKGYYQKEGKPTGTLEYIKVALRTLRKSYGRSVAGAFGPLSLKALQQGLIAQKLSRVYINKLIDVIRREFKWGISEQLLPASVFQALQTVPGLRKDRTAARETAPIRPVSDSIVNATLPHLSPVVATMVQFQRLTGARPAEVCMIRPADIDMSGAAWSYRPHTHKTEHHGRERIIFVGPRAQDVLRPYLLRDKEAYCFSPSDSERKRNAERREDGRTPMTPSQRKRRSKANRKRPPGNCYTSDSYRRAVERACDQAFPPPADLPEDELAAWQKSHRWAPNRLRHAAATEIRRRFGLEAVQVALGHSTADTSQIYAERDMAKAARSTIWPF